MRRCSFPRDLPGAQASEGHSDPKEGKNRDDFLTSPIRLESLAAPPLSFRGLIHTQLGLVLAAFAQ